jgi:protein-tyrosine-phosphatase
MHEDKYKLLIVCQANYCRSPAAEVILDQLLPHDKFFVNSAGLKPKSEPNMDIRSKNYLEQHGFNINKIHNPKLTTSMLLKKQDKILFMDLSAMDKLRKQYPDLKDKMELFNSPIVHYDISDPFLSSGDHYEEIMDNIQTLSKTWKVILTQKP